MSQKVTIGPIDLGPYTIRTFFDGERRYRVPNGVSEIRSAKTIVDGQVTESWWEGLSEDGWQRLREITS